ncbi:hypothetical protein B5C34_12320 [Pacificimonas flava]|uniref:Heavy-metal-associated domain-containing protein n=2 Tax=Pacificimonas TaxID=1960290 RepID=A0A219B724_9SPHN|nr:MULTISPECIES: hypothetical protein [Pacificimonas]MBZ6378549.1 heavy-metal-associated domain-containing protein [Pacificimonas aurantium]OWV34165.1 hypothetical protein B5C34_12320 [Pacificimonas flava]
MLRSLLPLLVLAAAGILGPATGRAQDESTLTSEAFTVTGIELDISADSNDAARQAAFREAPRRAWPRLWARLSGGAEDAAPSLSDAALSAMVEAIEVEEELIGGGRYLATLGVVFDRRRTGRRLPAGARVLQSEPMLLIPLLADAGALSTFDQESEWYEAWRRASLGGTIDYIQPSASLGDRIVVPGWQGIRTSRRAWRTVLGRFRAENVLIAEARIQRSYPGGPIAGRFTARYGPDGISLGSFSLRASSAGEYMDMLTTAVQRIDRLYAEALERGLLETEEQLRVSLASISGPDLEIDDGRAALGTVTVAVSTPDIEAWQDVEAALSSLPALEQVALTSFAIGGTSRVRLDYNGSEDELRSALARRGLRVTSGTNGLTLSLLSEAAPSGDSVGEQGVQPSQTGSSDAAAQPAATSEQAPQPANQSENSSARDLLPDTEDNGQ